MKERVGIIVLCSDKALKWLAVCTRMVSAEMLNCKLLAAGIKHLYFTVNDVIEITNGQPWEL